MSGQDRDPGLLREVRQAEAEIARATGKRYRIALDALDAESLRELRRLVRDLSDEASREKRRRQRGQFW